ncbi:MAG: hypothetical protein WKF47_13200 [Geodermatophilaceae bacterium]
MYTFASETPDWDGEWLVLLVSVPETERGLRRRARTRLAWAGFGSPAPASGSPRGRTSPTKPARCWPISA